MAELTLEEAPRKVRDLFNKGFAAFERGNLDYAIDLLFQVVVTEPHLLRARKFLRAAEIQKFKQKKANPLTKLLSSIMHMPAYLKAASIMKSGKPEQALVAAEELLRESPLELSYVNLLCQAAAQANLPEIAIQTLEIAREHHASDISVLNTLGNFYLKIGRTRSARECFEKLCELAPNDPDALKALKDALALDSMDTGGWAQATSYHDILKDSKDAEVLEQESKAVKTETDVDALIEETLKKIEQEPENINYFRHLSRLYAQKKMFDEAVATLRKAQEMSPGDAEIDAFVALTLAMQFDHEIGNLKAVGDVAGAEAKRIEKDQFLFDDLQQRVARYPNDLKLKYEWGVTLFQNDYFNEAIQQFQASQRSPRNRVLSLFYLGMCFKAKKQLDMALEQLEKAASELYTMDDTKKDVFYEMGLISEETGNKEKALEYYKQIYQADIGYKDVSQRVEKYYDK